MGKKLTLSKNQRGKKLTKDMFGWSVCKITNEVVVYFNTNKDDRSSVLVLIPKKAVKEANKRNLLRRRTKEVFRLSVKRHKPVDYLIKFSKFTEGFEDSLKDFFKNV